MTTGKRRRSIKEISPIDVYNLLPRTNCRECGEANCMAFATRLVNGEYVLEDCTPLLRPEYAHLHADLSDLLAPPVKAVTFGTGDRAVTVGGKHVLHRHDFTYHNPTAIALDVADSMPEEELERRVNEICGFSYTYIGRTLQLDAIAIRSTTGDPDAFARTVERVAATGYPLILCTLDPGVMQGGLSRVPEGRPLLYAATAANWEAMADLALQYGCPLVVSAPGDIPLLRSLVHTLLDCGVADLVLDPGTSVDAGLASTIMTSSAIRRAACLAHDDYLGFPLLGTPIAAWAGDELSPDAIRWKEACTAEMLITRYADLLILHSLEGWVLLPQLLWRFNLYTDPRKPVSVEPGVRTFGNPDRNSPLLITTNYALTFFTVESDIKAAHLDCHLIVADTGGISVESAVAGRYLTAEKVAETLREYRAEDLVGHRWLILPGLAARLSGETEEASGWRVLVGPKDSSGLAAFLREHWPPRGD
ncbi:MAG: acetyl-CoA decarbonylase/synthase complex subunit gamma [Methanomicrobiales archaeon]|nr:acetyl-CoA decarbonylase/synthase complex subunit gamma [Methanomicrobiales archaeon]MDI6876668.1 acetyl-CoA decarbonylase/synthase complex subunit gamma [Methanomicrobiales archaeon]